MERRSPRPARQVVSIAARRFLDRLQRHPSITLVLTPDGVEIYVVGLSDDAARREALRMLEQALSA